MGRVGDCFFFCLFVFLQDFIFIFTEGKGRRKRERNISVWLPLKCPLLGTWPATQACVLIGNQTHNPLDRRPALNLLSHTSQGKCLYFFLFIFSLRIELEIDGYSFSAL